MILDTDKLAAFHAVATQKSFSKAAETIFRTQPAISQAVGALEKDLGERLFLRLGRTVQLTQAGRILLRHADEIFESLDRARACIAALKELRTGELLIAASDTTTCYVLPAVLQAFRKQYPGIQLRIANRPSPVAVQQVASRDADIAIVTLPMNHPRLAVESLVAREDVAICSPRQALATKTRITLDQLVTYPMLLLDHGSSTRDFIDRQFEANHLAPTIAMELGSIEVIKKLVQSDFGVSIVPRLAVQAETAAGALHVLRVFPKTEWRILGVVYPAKGILNAAAQVFVDMLKKHFHAPSGAPSGTVFNPKPNSR